MPNLSLDGLVSGLNTTDLVTRLMQIERQPQARLTQKLDGAGSILALQQTLNARLLSVKGAAEALVNPSAWKPLRATSSAPDRVSVSAGPGAVAGKVSFTVDQVATAQTLVTMGSVSATTDPIIAAGTKLLVAPAGGLGLATMAGSAGLAAGDHTFAVTQSSAGASQSGTALGDAVTITAGQTLEVALDGSTTTTNTITLAAGTYSRVQLADMVRSASGGLLDAAIDNAGALRLTTAREGSAAQLAVTGGTGMAALGFTASPSASSGTDGVIQVDGVATTLTDIDPGSSVATTLAAGAGNTVDVTFRSGVRVGTVTAKNVHLGDGTLAAVMGAINDANAGVQATAVQVGPGAFKMQLTATNPGITYAVAMDISAFAGAMGRIHTLTPATDTVLTVGNGPMAYRVIAGGRTIMLMPGLAVTVSRAEAATVTVDVATDSNAIADRVSTLIDTVNGALSFIASQSRYDETRKSGGPLMSDSTARQIQQKLYEAISSVSAGTTLASVGISVNRDGSLAFDRAKFTDAYNANPSSVSAMFHEGSSVTATDDGLAKRLSILAREATDPISGQITAAINGIKSRQDGLRTQIAGWDVRLSLRERALRLQFTNLESSLGSLRSRSTWLAGQLASLPTANG